MADVQTISVVTAAASVVIAAVTMTMQSRDAKRTTQVQLFMQIYEHFNDPEFFDNFTDLITWKWKDYDDFIRRYGRAANPKAWYAMGSIAAFFEGIGVLVHRKLLDISLVGELMSRHIIMFWEKIEPISQEMRRRLKHPEIDRPTEYLYNEIVRMGRKNYPAH